MSTSEWTAERTELLKRLWEDGLNASDIARRLGGVTRKAVIGKLRRLRLLRNGDLRPREVGITDGEVRWRPRSGPRGLSPDAQPMELSRDETCPRFADHDRCIRLTMRAGGFPVLATDEKGRIIPRLLNAHGEPWQEIKQHGELVEWRR